MFKNIIMSDQIVSALKIWEGNVKEKHETVEEQKKLEKYIKKKL